MQKIHIPNLKPGVVIYKNIFDPGGKMLLRAGSVMNGKTIRKLSQYNLNSVYVKNPLLENLGDEWLQKADDSMPDIIQEETRLKAIEMLRSSFHKQASLNKQSSYRNMSSFSNMSAGIEIDARKIKQLANILIEEVLKNRYDLIHLSNICAYGDQIISHSVNVAAISAMLGTKLGYSMKQLFELTIGALVHDVGKLLMPPDILNKNDKLTEEEFAWLKQHPVLGFEILRKNKEFSLLSAHVAYQHHEKFDGTGYARAMKGQQIHEYARIVAIADVYEALVSDRHHRKAFMPHEAYEMMLAMSGTNFDREFLRLFLNQLIVYPLGTVIMLSNRMLAVVEKISSRLQLRPLVRVIAKDERTFLRNKSFSLDLSKSLNITITEILPEEKVCELIRNYQEIPK